MEGESMTTSAERRFTQVPVEMRAKDGQLRVGGYAAVFDRYSQNLGGFVEVVSRSFFNKSRGDGWPDVMARYNHDDNMLLGTTGGNTLQLRIDETGLDYEVDLPNARADIAELVARGDVRKSSFAFRVYNGGDEWSTTDQGYPLRTLVSGQLVDVAPVNTPAYLDSTAGLRSLAAKFDADPEEVRKLADADELRRFFVRTDRTTGLAVAVKPKPGIFGPVAAAQLLARRQDPFADA
jgi:HK97 family phage prohead protease